MTTDRKLDDNLVRDARLAKALEHMPDAHMQASAQARAAVLHAAQEAVDKKTIARPATLSHWWQSIWTTIAGSSGNRMPWNAAFATVLVASFITVLWQGKEVPDAKPDSEKISETAASTSANTSTNMPASTPVPAATADPADPADPADSAVAPVAAEQGQRQLPKLPKPKQQNIDKNIADSNAKYKASATDSVAGSSEPSASVAPAPSAEIAQNSSGTSPGTNMLPPPEVNTAGAGVATSAAASAPAAAAPAVMQATPRARGASRVEVESSALAAQDSASANKKTQREATRSKDATAGSFAKPPGQVSRLPSAVRIEFEGQEKIVSAQKAEALLKNLRKLTSNTTGKNDSVTSGTAQPATGSDFKVSLQGEDEVWTYDAKTSKLASRKYGESIGYARENVQINPTQYAQLRSLILALQGE